MADPVTLDLSELERAARLVHQVMPPTPFYAWPKLKRRSGVSVWVKHENHTPTGAFKVRGGIVFMERLRRERPEVPGIITATRGNHGQSLALSAARAGLKAVIYVPKGNSPDQNTAIAGFGAKLVEFGEDFEESRQEASRLAKSEGLEFVPPFHRDLVAGVASYALELFRAGQALDAVYVGVGMGSGICGLIAVRDALGLRTEIIGVSATNASANAQSYAAKQAVAAASSRTFADGLATRHPMAEAVATMVRGVARWVEVSEDEIAEAVRAYFDDTHQVAEGAGAAPLAALLKDRARMAGKQVGIILSGGNIERARFNQILGGITPQAN